MKYRDDSRRWAFVVAAIAVVGLGVHSIATAQVRYSYAQPPATQKKSAATVTEWRDALGRSPATQVTEKRGTTGGRDTKTSSWDTLSGGGSSQHAVEGEEETQRLDDKTVRVVHRLFGTDANGNRKMLAITEEEKRTLPGGRETLVRTVSQPDLNGGLQVIRRDLEETKTVSSGATESRTTVLRPGLEQGLVPHEQVLKIDRKQGDVQKVHTTRLLPNGNGGWQINKEEDSVIKTESKNARTEEERVYQRDAQQNLSVAKQVVTRDWKDATGQEHRTVETYLTNTPGTTVSGDGRLNLDHRLRVVRLTSPDGTQQTEEQQEDRDLNAPFNALRVAQKTVEISASDRTGHNTRQGTVEAFDGNGNTRVIWVFNTQQTKQ